MKKFFSYHIVPIAIALVVVGVGIWLLSLAKISPTPLTPELISISYDLDASRGLASNLISEENQTKLYSSFKNNHLTIFGSSEFDGSPFAPYHFLPDSAGFSVFGVGQGYHQSLSILIECLAFADEIEGKSICLVLSPGWFESNGTNPSAFIKSANSNFLNRIILNPNLPKKYKEYLGKYVFDHESEMASLSYQMEFLKIKYQENLPLTFSSFFPKLKQKIKEVVPVGYVFDTVVYQTFNTIKKDTSNRKIIDYNALENSVQRLFIASITNNSIFVNNGYYDSYLRDKSKAKMEGIIVPNKELEDLEILVQFLTEKKVKLSFIMQPLSPYYFDNLEALNPILTEITKLTESYSVPFLNLYVTQESDYEPGTLTDIMHTGDYGWLKINKFLDSLYHE